VEAGGGSGGNHGSFVVALRLCLFCGCDSFVAVRVRLQFAVFVCGQLFM